MLLVKFQLECLYPKFIKTTTMKHLFKYRLRIMLEAREKGNLNEFIQIAQDIAEHQKKDNIDLKVVRWAKQKNII